MRLPDYPEWYGENSQIQKCILFLFCGNFSTIHKKKNETYVKNRSLLNFTRYKNMQAHLLWADDEIDLLKPHILFLEGKGYKVSTVNNGNDAVELVKTENIDLVFLDENMPGISGIDALAEIKQIKPNLPVIMITKNEEEHIMEEAIGSKI